MKKQYTKGSCIAENEKGFTLLEYCAGAAILAGIIYVALTAMGNNISGLLESIGGWATKRATQINAAP